MTARPSGIGSIAAAARFVATIHDRALPDEVLAEAKKCFIDWCAVAIGASAEEAGRIVREVAGAWGTRGEATVLLGGKAAPTAAALVNGTLAHCLDFDDTHVASTAHLSSPTWAAAFSVGTARNVSEIELLAGFAAGFEVGGRFGGLGYGVLANERGWHPTGIFGCLGAAAAAAAVMRLDEDAVERTLGGAATQTGGNTDSFGTMAKPFHAGKAAFNGVLSAELAAAGFETSRTILEPDRGLSIAVVQDRSMALPRFDPDAEWELLRNTFKPYACCLLTHATVDAARSLAPALRGQRVAKVTARVNPLAIRLAGKPKPTTPLEAKFSTAFCAALGLAGHTASQGDFVDARVADAQLQALVDRTEVVAAPEFEKTAAAMRVTLEDGTVLDSVTALAKGNPGNPMSMDDMRGKFFPLVEPVLGRNKAQELYEVLATFEQPGRLGELKALVGRKPRRR
jgi:2-methylcitrate dehydratase PrpD